MFARLFGRASLLWLPVLSAILSDYSLNPRQCLFLRVVIVLLGCIGASCTSYPVNPIITISFRFRFDGGVLFAKVCRSGVSDFSLFAKQLMDLPLIHNLHHC